MNRLCERSVLCSWLNFYHWQSFYNDQTGCFFFASGRAYTQLKLCRSASVAHSGMSGETGYPQPSSPEFLGSPWCYVVTPGHGLLWPHPSLSAPSFGLFSSSIGSLPLRPRMGWCRQIPQFAPRIYNSVPSSVSRRSCRVHLVVYSPTVIAFAISALARQPYPTHAGSHVGTVTRLQSSLYATARRLDSPSPARTFTIELSPDVSPRAYVDYNYAANNQLPQPDFHRQDTRPYGLRTKARKH